TEAQRRALDDLQAALGVAFERTRASCLSAMPPSAVARLEALGKRIDAMQAALRLVRAPLGALNASLTDEQKARLNATRREPVVGRNTSSGGDVRACAQPTDGIMQATAGALFATVSPNAEQRPDGEILAGTFGHAAEIMTTS